MPSPAIDEVYQDRIAVALQNIQDSIPPQKEMAISSNPFPTWHPLEISNAPPFFYLQTMAANNYAVMGTGTDNLRDNKPFVFSKYRRVSNIGRSIMVDGFKEISRVRGGAAFKYGIGTNGEVLQLSSPTIQEGQASTTVTIQGGNLNTALIGLQHTGSNKTKNIQYHLNAAYQRGEDFTFSDEVVNDRNIKSTITLPSIASQGYIDTKEIGSEVVKTDGLFTDTYKNILADIEVNWIPNKDVDISLFGGYTQSNGLTFQHIGETYTSDGELWGGLHIKNNGFEAKVSLSNYANDKGKIPSYSYLSGFTGYLSNQTLNATLSYSDSLNFLNLKWIAGLNYDQITTDTKNQVFGRNETNDDYANYGGFIETELAINNQLTALLAARYDYIKAIDQFGLSYGATLNYQIDKQHIIRATYTKSIQTPDPFTLYADMPIRSNTGYDVWLSGNVQAQNVSSIPLIDWTSDVFFPTPYVAGFSLSSAYIEVLEHGKEALEEMIIAIPDGRRLWGALDFVLTEEFAPVRFANNYTSNNLFTGSSAVPTNAAAARLASQELISLEYEGRPTDKLKVQIGAYHLKRKNLNQLALLSPIITLESLGLELGDAVQRKIQPEFEELLLNAGGFTEEDAAETADEIGVLIKEVYTSQGDALLEAFNNTGLPFHGVVMTDRTPETGNPPIMAGYHTLDQITYVGIEADLKYELTDKLSVLVEYNWLNKNIFTPTIVDSDNPYIYYLNRPQNKATFGLQYQPNRGLNGQLSYRYESAFESLYGFISAPIEEKNLIDVALGYNFRNGLSIGLNLANALDNKYKNYPTLPLIGRRVLGSVQYQF